MRILGIHDGHNSSLALLEDGEVTFALQEERPASVKNSYGFPAQALACLFAYHNIAPDNIDFVALSSRYMSRPLSNEDLRSHYGWQGTPLAIAVKKVTKLRAAQRLREHNSLNRRLRTLADTTVRAQILEPGQNPGVETILVEFESRT